MSKERDDATHRIFAALDQFERDLDQASISGAKLLAELPQARLDAKFAAEVGQGAFVHLVGSLGDIAAARGRMIDGHRELAVVGRKFKLPVVAGGDKTGTPPPSAIGSETERARPLRVA
jgi:hypothetical protein